MMRQPRSWTGAQARPDRQRRRLLRRGLALAATSLPAAPLAAPFLSGAPLATAARLGALGLVAGPVSASEAPGSGAPLTLEMPPGAPPGAPPGTPSGTPPGAPTGAPAEASATVAAEATIEVQSAGLRLAADAESYQLHSDLQIVLNPTLAEAVGKGIALYFVLECEILRPRWYWTDEKVVARDRVYRLAFHALTRQYRVQIGQGGLGAGQAVSGSAQPASWYVWLWGGSGSGAGAGPGAGPGAGVGSGAGVGAGSTTGGGSLFVQSYASLREALAALGRVRGLRMVEAGKLQPGQAYELRVRMRLDAALLPRLFQVPGIAQKDWAIESPWKRFSFEIETRKNAP